jgi:trimethylamine:corrinoid methyltransferase-like protein
LLPREPYDAWVENGSRSALDRARERAHDILARHQPRRLDPALEQELDAYRQMVALRPMDEFYAGEMLERQDLTAL